MNDDFLIKPSPKKKPEATPPEPEPAPLDEEPTSEGGHESIDIAGGSDQSDESDTSKDAKEKAPKAGKKKRRNPKQWFLDLSKKKKILVVVAAILLIAGGVAGAMVLTRNDEPTPVAKKQAAQKAKPTTEASRLTGVQISPELNKRGVIGVMVENHEEAWPQSGLNKAGVIFEAIAEGGITRFLVLYQEDQPDYIGPVRSVRPYYLDWLQGFDAPIAHAGGSAEGLAKIKSEGIKDLDQFVHSAAYQRVDGRYAPHDLYTSIAALDTLKNSKGYTTSTFNGFIRKKAKAAKVPTAKSIDVGVSIGMYKPHYDYDAESNSYKRSQNGQPHLDEKSGAQLSPNVVVAMVMDKGNNGSYSTYNTIGSGACFVFQDGTVTEGTWEKASSTTQIIFKDARGNDLKLNPGQTWISAVPSSVSVTYTP